MHRSHRMAMNEWWDDVKWMENEKKSLAIDQAWSDDRWGSGGWPWSYVENRERDSRMESPSTMWQTLKVCREMTWSRKDPVLYWGEMNRQEELGSSNWALVIGRWRSIWRFSPGRPGKVRPNPTGIFPRDTRQTLSGSGFLDECMKKVSARSLHWSGLLIYPMGQSARQSGSSMGWRPMGRRKWTPTGQDPPGTIGTVNEGWSNGHNGGESHFPRSHGPWSLGRWSGMARGSGHMTLVGLVAWFSIVAIFLASPPFYPLPTIFSEPLASLKRA